MMTKMWKARRAYTFVSCVKKQCDITSKKREERKRVCVRCEDYKGGKLSLHSLAGVLDGDFLGCSVCSVAKGVVNRMRIIGKVLKFFFLSPLTLFSFSPLCFFVGAVFHACLMM